MKEISAVLFLVLFYWEPIFSQEIILTYEIDRQHSHSPEVYHWLTRLDDEKLYPIYFKYESFSKDNLDRCLEGKAIDIFISTTGSNWDFSDDYMQMLREVVKEVDRKKQLHMDVKSKKGNQFTRIKVYYSVIDVVLCSCQIGPESGKLIDYQGDIFLPTSFSKDKIEFDKKIIEKHLKEIDIIFIPLENMI